VINPRYTGLPLKGNSGELWRYRIGDYRLICTIDDENEIITVQDIGHRSNVYKKH
jgi:mRNA interferase RelE/StbE